MAGQPKWGGRVEEGLGCVLRPRRHLDSALRYFITIRFLSTPINYEQHFLTLSNSEPRTPRNNNEHTGNKIEQAALFLSYVDNKTSVATHVRLFNKTRKLMVMEEPECRGVIKTRINVHSTHQNPKSLEVLPYQCPPTVRRFLGPVRGSSRSRES
ncbi:MAG: hypothetical protein GY820_03275 [Gammaproteobacteria bacterium]|nr:hypothetical protein [Gammaproteobacteria bacterium]